MKGYAAGVLLSDKKSPFEKALTPVQCSHEAYEEDRITKKEFSDSVAGIKEKEELLQHAFN